MASYNTEHRSKIWAGISTGYREKVKRGHDIMLGENSFFVGGGSDKVKIGKKKGKGVGGGVPQKAVASYATFQDNLTLELCMLSYNLVNFLERNHFPFRG